MVINSTESTKKESRQDQETTPKVLAAHRQEVVLENNNADVVELEFVPSFAAQ